jgi:uncharacterized membrane protein
MEVMPVNDRGQASVMVLSVSLAMFVTLSAATVTFGGHVLDRRRAQTVADAAALAALDGGRAAADSIARRHDATVVSYRDDGDHVTVSVRVGSSSASAAATDAP